MIIFKGVSEVMIVELSYIFGPLFYESRVKNTENETQASKTFLQNLMRILYSWWDSNLSIGFAAFQVSSELTFCLKLSLYLHSFKNTSR